MALVDTPAAPGVTRVGWVGTGVMGRAMAEHVLTAGFTLTVFNRSPEKLAPLLARGAKEAANPAAVAAASDVVGVIVGFPSDVREVFLGEHGLIAHSQPGTVLVDLTTSGPALAVELNAACSAAGVRFLDAPVTGGDVGARAGTLSVMVGGDFATLELVRPVLDAFSQTLIHQGPAGAGQRTKLVNQILISSTMVAVCEALLFADRAGLNLETVLQSVSAGAAGSKALEVLGPRLLAGDFAPGFFIEHFLKDLALALAEAERLHLALPGLALAKQLYEAARAQGHGRLGTQALILALRQLNTAR